MVEQGQFPMLQTCFFKNLLWTYSIWNRSLRKASKQTKNLTEQNSLFHSVKHSQSQSSHRINNMSGKTFVDSSIYLSNKHLLASTKYLTLFKAWKQGTPLHIRHLQILVTVTANPKKYGLWKQTISATKFECGLTRDCYSTERKGRKGRRRYHLSWDLNKWKKCIHAGGTATPRP